MYLFITDSPNDMTTNAVLMTITGFFIGGVANLVSAAISADLGKTERSTMGMYLEKKARFFLLVDLRTLLLQFSVK